MLHVWCSKRRAELGIKLHFSSTNYKVLHCRLRVVTESWFWQKIAQEKYKVALQCLPSVVTESWVGQLAQEPVDLQTRNRHQASFGNFCTDPTSYAHQHCHIVSFCWFSQKVPGTNKLAWTTLFSASSPSCGQALPSSCSSALSYAPINIATLFQNRLCLSNGLWSPSPPSPSAG